MVALIAHIQSKDKKRPNSLGVQQLPTLSGALEEQFDLSGRKKHFYVQNATRTHKG